MKILWFSVYLIIAKNRFLSMSIVTVLTIYQMVDQQVPSTSSISFICTYRRPATKLNNAIT